MHEWQTTSAPIGLAPKSLGAKQLFFITVSASAPMTVIAGAVVATYAVTGVVGIPLSYLLLAAALAFFTVGYVAMSKYVSHAGVFYAYPARGLGRVFGLSGAMVALLAYNAIQICLYGLFGASMAGLIAPLVALPWWAWALFAWAAIAVFGVLRIRINARLLAVMLIVEIGMIVLLDAASFAHPAGGSISASPLLPTSLFVNGLGGVLAFGIASFVGYEAGPVYAEEVRGHQAVRRASFVTLAFLGVLYAASSWGTAVAFGPSQVVNAARDPNSGIPFVVLDRTFGPLVSSLASVLLLTSIFAAMLSFHHSVARYIYTLSRERVLPAALDRIGSSSGAPIGGSLVQSAIALAVFGAFALAGADPIIMLFTWLSGLAAIGVVVLMIGASAAVIGFFIRHRDLDEPPWRTVIAPVCGGFALTVVLGAMLVNINSVLGVAPGSPMTWIVPALVVLAAAAGAVWALVLRVARPDVYDNVGRGEPRPLTVLEPSLAGIVV